MVPPTPDPRPPRPERVEVACPPELPAAVVLEVDSCARRWAVVHTTYTICTGLAIARPAGWRYRSRTHYQPADGVSLMEPGELHANTVQTDVASFRVLMIDPAHLELAAHELGMRRTPHFRLAQTDSARHPQLRAALLGLHGSLEGEATPLERQENFDACLRLLLEQVTETPIAEARPARDRSGVERARDYVEAHLEQPISLDDLVAAAGSSSRYQLAHSFKQTIGLAPHAYQISRRIAKARLRLAAGDPPAWVAVDLGFADQSHLSRHFTRALGISPGAYARGVRGPGRRATTL